MFTFRRAICARTHSFIYACVRACGTVRGMGRERGRGMTEGLYGLIGHNGLIRLNGQTRHNGQVCCTDNITHQQRKGLQYTKNWPHKKTVRQQPSCETGHFATQNGPFRTMKWAVSESKMGRFGGRNGPFCNALCASTLRGIKTTARPSQPIMQ